MIRWKKLKTNHPQKWRGYVFSAICLLLVIGLCGAVYRSLITGDELRVLLEDSVESQLKSACWAAEQIIDKEKFAGYNSKDDIAADRENYQETLALLRKLVRETGAQYIYAFKKIGDEYYFIFDTDEEDNAVFTAYELGDVHKEAFRGKATAGLMNSADHWGSYNSGAMPLRDKSGEIIGIVGVDMPDKFIKRNLQATRYNSFLLIFASAIIAAMCLLMLLLMRRLNKARAKLFLMANYDVITGLPNRQYLIDYLNKISANQEPFALMFIDLDNFKKVNDNSGHDAGDELLRSIAGCLNKSPDNLAKAFHPAPGSLNVSARVGGDEFVQVVRRIDSPAEADAAAKKLFENFSALRETNTLIQKYNVGLSVGVALFPLHASNYNVIIKYADIAMYEAKQSGKNQYRIYEDGMIEAAQAEPGQIDRRARRRAD